MRVDLENLPSLKRDLDWLPVALHPPEVERGAGSVERSVAFSAAEPAGVLPRSLVEVLEGVVLGKQANLNLVTGNVEEGRIGSEYLAEDMLGEVLEP